MAQDVLARILAVSAGEGSVGPMGPTGATGPMGPTGPQGEGAIISAGAGIVIDENNKISEMVPVGQMDTTISVEGIIAHGFERNGQAWICKDSRVSDIYSYLTNGVSARLVFNNLANDESVVFTNWAQWSSGTDLHKTGTVNAKYNNWTLSYIEFYPNATEPYIRIYTNSGSAPTQIDYLIMTIPNCGLTDAVTLNLPVKLSPNWINVNKSAEVGNVNNSLYIDDNGKLCAGYSQPQYPLVTQNSYTGDKVSNSLKLAMDSKVFVLESNRLSTLAKIGKSNVLVYECTPTATEEQNVYDIPLSAVSKGIWDAKCDSGYIFTINYNSYTTASNGFRYAQTIDLQSGTITQTYTYTGSLTIVFKKETSMSTGESTYSAKATYSSALTFLKIYASDDTPNPYGDPIVIAPLYCDFLEGKVVSQTPEVVGTFTGKFFQNNGNTNVPAGGIAYRDLLSTADNSIGAITAYNGDVISALDISQTEIYVATGGIGARTYEKGTDYTLSQSTVGGYLKTEIVFDSSLPIANYLKIYVWKNYLIYENLQNSNYQVGQNMTGDLTISTDSKVEKYFVKESYLPSTVATKEWVSEAIHQALANL